jgi:xanthine/uracil permease
MGLDLFANPHDSLNDLLGIFGPSWRRESFILPKDFVDLRRNNDSSDPLGPSVSTVGRTLFGSPSQFHHSGPSWDGGHSRGHDCRRNLSHLLERFKINALFGVPFHGQRNWGNPYPHCHHPSPVLSSHDPIVFSISLIVIGAIALFSHWLKGFLKTISLFLGILFGTFLMLALGRLEFTGIQEAGWFKTPQPFLPDFPQFSISATLTFLVAYVAVIINAVGSIYSIGEVVGKEGIRERVTRGIRLTGVGGLAAGALGVIGTVSYGISPGVVLVTRVGSRFAVTVCGALLLFLAFFQKILAVISAIPASVVGAAMITGMAAQTGAGISIFNRSGRTLDGRDYLVIGIPILLGGIVSIFPEGFFQVFPFAAQALLKNGLVVGIVLVLILEHLLLRRRD